MIDKYGVGDDPYLIPGTDVLRNKLGITDAEKLGAAEREITQRAAEQFTFIPQPYTLETLRDIHHSLFFEIYEWAGKIRTVDISKGHTRFCNCLRIIPEAERLFANLEQSEFFLDLNREELIVSAADLYGDINAVHPFREGNGRAQRLLFEHIIINTGHDVTWEPITQEEWIHANEMAFFGSNTSLENIFEKCITTPIV